jgi:hypothetical protein
MDGSELLRRKGFLSLAAIDTKNMAIGAVERDRSK